MNKTDQNLKDAIASNENRALWFAGAVVFGLVLEVIFAAAFREPPETLLSHWGPVGSDVIVALGVAGEVWFGRKSRIDSEELTRRSEERLAEANASAAEAIERAAEANERAAAAGLETERLRKELAWRRVSNDQANKISNFLAPLPKFGLRIILAPDNIETLTFARDIADIFRKDGWRVQFMLMTSAGSFEGMMIPLYAPPDLDASGITRTAFLTAGIEFTGGAPEPRGGMMTVSGDDVSSPYADIHLGSKPRPNLG